MIRGIIISRLQWGESGLYRFKTPAYSWKVETNAPYFISHKTPLFFNSPYIETKSCEGEVESKSNLNFLLLKYTCF